MKIRQRHDARINTLKDVLESVGREFLDEDVFMA